MNDTDKIIELAQELGRAREKVEYLEGYVRALQNETTGVQKQPSAQEEPPEWPAVYSGMEISVDHCWIDWDGIWGKSTVMQHRDIIAPPGFEGLKDLSAYTVLRVVTEEDVKSWGQDEGGQ